MKKNWWLSLIVLNIAVSQKVCSQAFIKADYIGSSGYRDMENEKTGGKGDAKVVQAGFNIPLSLKMNDNNQPTAWGIGLGGSYTKMNNRKLEEYIMLSEILNFQLGLSHMLPLTKKLSLLASVGVGLYMGTPSLSHASFDNVLASGGTVLIWRLRKNLDAGAGLAINTAFGYPMAFPALYLNWRIDGKYKVNVAMMEGMEVSAGIQLTDYLDLNLIAEMNGSLALVKVEEKKKMFSHNYITVGLQPVFKITKSWSVPVTLGISATRMAYYDDRNLKAFFKAMDREYDPYFTPAFYGSVAVRYGF